MSRKRHINRWIGGAYLTRDPELSATPNGNPVCNMRIGVHDAGEDYSDGYFDLAVFGDQAEHCARYLNAGSEIDVEARLRFREFERDDGSKGTAVSLIADRVNFAGGGRNGKTSSEEEGSPDDPAAVAAAGEDDIPS
jgi:single-strand DNA-binding protein